MNPFVPDETENRRDSSTDRHCLSQSIKDPSNKFAGDHNPKTMKKLLLESDCNLPQSSIREKPTDSTSIQVLNVELQGLDCTDSEVSIKQKLKEHKHIVSIKPKMDYLSGQCKGSA